MPVCELNVSCGLNSISMETEGGRLFLSGKRSERHPLVLKGSICTDGEEADEVESVTFYLYRQGEALPVETAVCPVSNYGGFQYTFPINGNTSHPGNYFLLGENLHEHASPYRDEEEAHSAIIRLNGHLVFPFSLLPAGEELTHPMPVSAVACRPAASAEAGGYTSGNLQLKVQTSDPLTAESELTAWCYTADWSLFAEAAYYVSGKGIGARRFSLRFHSKVIWMPGDYFVVLCHNRDPYSLLSFRYNGQEKTACECRPLSGEDTEYLMVKYLEADKDNKWEQARSLQGIGRLKPQLVRMACSGWFNAYCAERGVEQLRVNSYAVVMAERSFHARRLAYCLPRLLGFGTKEYRQVDCGEWSTHPEQVREELAYRNGYTLALYGLSVLLESSGSELLGYLMEIMPDRDISDAFILCDRREVIEELFRKVPAMERLFPAERRFSTGSYSAMEVARLLQCNITEEGIFLSAEAEQALALQVMEHLEALCSWDGEDYAKFASDGVYPRFRKRMSSACRYTPAPEKELRLVIQPEDIDLEGYLKKVEARETQEVRKIQIAESENNGFELCMKELDEMVGLSALKEELAATFFQVRFEEARRRMGLPNGAGGTHHMIFTGNPGTGKTTVAKLIGKIYHAMGLISKGEVIATERSQLVGRYIGQTEETMVELLKQAKGNVLFIDEAYTLCDTADDRKDFGYHVIESLLTVLAEPHPDMIVILAGYAEEMERLMQVNPGLKGRFPHQFHFEDYSADELMQIAARWLEQNQYQLSAEAHELFSLTVSKALACKDRYFANARWIKQFLESGILPAMARRVMQSGRMPTKEACCTIERTDVEQAASKYRMQPPLELAPRRRIGFRA